MSARPGVVQRTLRRAAVMPALLALCYSVSAHAATGLEWLASWQNTDGSFANTPTSLATPVQSTAEVLRAYQTLKLPAQPGSAAALTFLNTDTENNTEYLARKIIINAQSGSIVSALTTALLTHQNADGGFGDQTGYASSVLDTALALEALAVAHFGDANVIGRAVFFLTQQQQADGGFNLTAGNTTSVYLTSRALLALQGVQFNYNVAANIGQVREYLLQKQITGGGWSDDGDTVMALVAVIPVTTDATRYVDALNVLRAHQHTDGSWGADSYTTALALRALYLAANTNTSVTPTLGNLTGRVVDNVTGLPLAGVMVTLDTLAGITATTTASGVFTLAGVTPALYTLRCQLAGYAVLTQSTSAQAGRVNDLGSLRLNALPTVGIITGTVADATRGQPLNGATIQISGALTTSTTTDASGSYRVVSSPGPITVSASAPGYDSVSGTGSVAAGLTLSFSPALRPTGTTPTDPQVKVKGSVLDGDTGTPLSGVVISVAGSVQSGTTDNTGAFLITGLGAGELAIDVTQTGYQPVRYTAVAPAGSIVDLGTIRLSALSTVGVITGTVVDATSGRPLNGVLIQVTGTTTASTATDTLGTFRLVSPPGPITISASATGYDSASGAGTVVAGGTLNFSPALPPTGTTPTDPQVKVKGLVFDDQTNTPLPGVTITVVGNNPSATSDNSGAFLVTGLSAGTLVIDVAKTGYQTIQYTAVATAGSSIDLGTVRLKKAATTTTVTGRVIDAASGAPVAGASISVSGSSAGAVSAADGSYRIEGITTTQFTLTTVAVGYLTATGNASLPQFGSATIDIPLQRAAAPNFDITRVTSVNPSYPALTKVELTATLQNTSAVPITVRLFVKAVNAANEIVDQYPAITIPLGGDPSSALVTVNSSTQQDSLVTWQTARHLPGAYQVIVQAFDAVSGQLLAERGTPVQVEPTNRIGGYAQFDPPIAQLAAKKPVSITATLTNQGNLALAAGTAIAKVSLKNPGYQPRQDSVSVDTFAASPDISGQNGEGSAIDANGNLYIAEQSSNKVLKVSSAGVVSVFADGLQSPVDVDLDHLGNVYVLSYYGDYYKIASDGTRTQIKTGLGSARAIEALDDGRVYIVKFNALYEVSPTGVVTQRVAGGLSAPQGIAIASNGDVFIANRGENSVSRYSTTGQLSIFATGIAQPYGITLDAAGNLYVTSFSGNTLHKVTPAGVVSTIATGLAGPYDVKIAPNGNFIVSNYNSNQIVSVTPTGVVSVLVEATLYNPGALAADGAGNLYVANALAQNIVKLGVDGSTRTVLTGVPSVNDLLVSDTGSIHWVDQTGRLTRLAVDGSQTVLASGLSAPSAFIAAPDGNGFLVTEPGQNRIRRVDAAGAVSVYDDAQFALPRVMHMDTAGNQFILTQYNYITKIAADGQVSRVVSGLNNAYDLAIDASGNLIVAEYSLRQLLRIDSNGIASVLVTLPFNPSAVAVAPNGNILVAALNGTAVFSVDNAGAVSSYATLTHPISAGMLMDANGTLWVAHASNNLVTRVLPDGTQSTFVVVSAPRAFAADGQGGVYVAALNAVKHIDSAGVVTDRVTGGVLANQYQNGVGVDSAGRMWVMGANGLLARYHPDWSLDKQFTTLSSPAGLIADNAGNLIVLNGNSFIVKLTGANTLPEIIGTGYFSRITRDTAQSLLVSTQQTVQRFDPATGTLTPVISGLLNNHGAVRRADGSIVVVDYSRNDMSFYTGAGVLTDRFAGLVRPKGLLFDSSGQLLVVNSAPNALSRVRTDGRVETFSTVSDINYLSLEADGSLLGARSSDIVTLSASGAQLKSVATLSAYGIARTPTGTLMAADFNDGALLRYAADGTYVKVASGLSNARDVEAGPNGLLYVSDTARGVVVAVSPDNSLSLVASGLPAAERMAVAADGSVYVAYNSTKIAHFDTAGLRTELPLTDLLTLPTAGLVVQGSTLYAVSPYQNVVYRITTNTGVPTVQPGDAVYTASVSMPGLDPSVQPLSLDFGSWIPQVSGDYLVEVSVPGAGAITNTLHVGPNANGSFDLAQTQVAPGSRPVTGYLRVLGADSTSITRIDTAGTHLAAASGAQGRAIGADSRGNIYAADTTRIVKIAPDGAVSNFVIGISIGAGLAVDSKDNIYAVSNTKVLKIAPDATVTTLVTTVGPSVAAVVVGYDDLVYFTDSSNTLSRVNSDRSVTVVSKAGMSGPVGLTVDAFGNFYVLNTGPGFPSSITRITPDGKAARYFDQARFESEGINVTADCSNNLLFAPFLMPPIKTPYGEEDTIVQLVGDTGEVRQVLYGPSIDPGLSDMDVLFYDRFGKRLLIWTDSSNGKIFAFPAVCGGIDAEAHIITSNSVDLSSADPAPTSKADLGDGTSEYVWLLSQVDNRGQQIQLNLLFKDIAEGESRAAAKDAFLLFKNSFVPSESVRVPIAIPKLLAASAVTIQPSLDASQYGPNSMVTISVSVSNQNPGAFHGTLELAIVDAAGAPVASLPSVPVTALNGLSVRAYPSSWATGTTLAGSYTLTAALKNSVGQRAAYGEVPFRIIAGGASASVVTLRTTTDRPVYNTTDQVLIQNLVGNVTTNAIVDNALLRLTVLDAANQVLFTHDGSLGSLPPGSLRDLMLPYTLNGAGIATYQVHGDVIDATTQAVLASAEVSFEVRQDTSKSLTGHVDVAHPSIEPGATQTCTATLSNKGTVAVTGLEVHHALINMDVGQMDNELLQTVNLDPGASTTYGYSFGAQGLASGNYACALQARINGDIKTLAFTPFRVTQPPIKLDATLKLGAKGRLLVLLDNTRHPAEGDDDHKTGCDGVKRIALTATLPATLSPSAVVEARVYRNNMLVDSESANLASFTGPVNVSAGSRYGDLTLSGLTDHNLTLTLTPAVGETQLDSEYTVEAIIIDGNTLTLRSDTLSTSCDHPLAVGQVHQAFTVSALDRLPAANDGKVNDADPHGPKTAPGLTAQRAFLEQLLKAAGWSYTLTDTAEDFTRAFHTGGYTTYALLAEDEKLSEQTQRELREAVYRGDGLVVAGAHDSENLHDGRLRDALGLKLIGNVSNANGVDLQPSPLALSGHINLIPDDRAMRIKRTTATLAGVYTVSAANSHDADDCRDDDADDKDHDACEGHPETYRDAITLNAYGYGRAGFAGFDLLPTATRDGQTSLTAETLRKLLGYGVPSTLATGPGAVVPLELTLKNQGVAVSVTATLPLPVGMQLMDPGSASVSGQTLTWTLSLAVNDEKTLRLWVRLPDQEGPVALTASVIASAAGATLSYAPMLTLAVVQPPTLGSLKAQLDVLIQANPPDKKALSQARESLDKALKNMTPAPAIKDVLKATDALLKVTDPAVVAIRAGLDTWLQWAAQYAY